MDGSRKDRYHNSTYSSLTIMMGSGTYKCEGTSNLQISRDKEELTNIKGPVTYKYQGAKMNLQISKDKEELTNIKGQRGTYKYQRTKRNLQISKDKEELTNIKGQNGTYKYQRNSNL